MLRINVLDREGGRFLSRTRGFWYPVYLNRRYLREIGLTFHFFPDMHQGICDCDILWLSSRYFHLEGQSESRKVAILEALASLKSKVGKIFWFDLRDSTGNTQFEVLPYVSKYLKKQLLRDRMTYRRQLYGNRIYTDFFHREFGIEDAYVQESAPLAEGSEEKLGISWNIGMHDNRGGGILTRLLYLFADQIEALSGGDHKIPWQPCSKRRDIDLVALFQLEYERNTVGFQRRRAAQILKRLKDANIVTGERVPRRHYLAMIAKTKIVLSLFGWGEICFRDSEAFIAGAALLMPDVSHLETWPAVYIPYETYWPLKWDLSDLEESCRYLLSDGSARLEVARSGQDRYRALWTREGRKQFCDRLREVVLDVVNQR